MKYVMFRKALDSVTLFVPVIFPNALVHADVAEAMMAGPLKDHFVHSAGEVSLFGGRAAVSGESETLNRKCDPGDARRIMMSDYGGLIE